MPFRMWFYPLPSLLALAGWIFVLGSSELPVLIAATGGTERHSLVLEHALRPMFSYLHAVVSPTGVYAATVDFGASDSTADLSQRIAKAAADFTRLVRSCGPRTRRDTFAEELAEMQRLLGSGD